MASSSSRPHRQLSSSRPHRQARSGVSYRDPYHDYDEDLSFCRRQRSSPSSAIATTTKKCKDSQNAAKKNLALKPTARCKERAEAVQLQRAINESLMKGSPEATACLERAIHGPLPDSSADAIISVFNHEKDVVDCMDEDVLNSFSNHEKIMMDCRDEVSCNNYVAFQCLLDVATEAVLGGVPESQGTKEGLTRRQTEEKKVLELSVGILHNGETVNEEPVYEVNVENDKCKEYSQDKDQINILDETDTDTSDEREEGNSKQVDTEDESSDLSDESGCERKRPVKVQQNDRKAAVEDHIIPVQLKKRRSARPLLKLKAEALSIANCQTSLSSPGRRLVQQVKAPGGKENSSTSPSTQSMESTKNMASNFKQRIVAENGVAVKSCQSVKDFHGSWKVNKLQVFDSVFPGQQGHSPTLLHRRVIGLSRRCRPPPLHPYLTKQDR